LRDIVHRREAGNHRLLRLRIAGPRHGHWEVGQLRESCELARLAFLAAEFKLQAAHIGRNGREPFPDPDQLSERQFSRGVKAAPVAAAWMATHHGMDVCD
jgi:hypothetical protein